MLRRTGFKSTPRDPDRVRSVPRPVAGAFRMGEPVVAGPAQPKREYIRSKPLLAAVRTIPCQHCGCATGVEASHNNQGAHGKGLGIKADDNRIAALCWICHRIVDRSSKLSQEARLAIWWQAHVKTVKVLVRLGLWPANVPIPDIRSFDA